MQRTCLQNICFPMELAGVGQEGGPGQRALAASGRWSGCPIRPRPIPRSSPAVSSSALPSPGPWPPIPRCCCATRPPAPWTPRPPAQILELIQDINRKLGITVVVITHQMSVVKEICTHVAILDDGEVVEDGLVSAVFSAPKSQAARRLVFPGRGRRGSVRPQPRSGASALIFRSAHDHGHPHGGPAGGGGEHLLPTSSGAPAPRSCRRKVYGSMLLGIPNSQFDRAWQFFRTIPNLQAEEVSVDVQ